MAVTNEMLVADVNGETYMVVGPGQNVDWHLYCTSAAACFDGGAALQFMKDHGLVEANVITYSAWKAAH